MRIAVVSPEFPPELGGIQSYAWEVTHELLARGHEVTVFTRPHPQGEAKLDARARVLPVLRMRRPADRATFAAHQADAWHVMNAAYAWIALEGKNTVVSVHGNDFLRPYMPLAMPDLQRLPGGWRLAGREPAWLQRLALRRTAALLQRALPRARHVIANSRYTERTLVELVPGCRGRTSVAWPGTPARFFELQRCPAADGVARLLTVCRLAEPRKNVDLVLRALATLRQHRFRYTIVGDGHDRPRLEALAHELGLAAQVHFAGFASDQALLDAYAGADLMVMTSSIVPGSHEGFGIVYLEAAAAGVPSLAARVAGAAEAVEEGVSGWFVDTPAVESIAARLDDFLAGRIGADPAACRAFARRFSYREVVDHALAHYGVGHG